ncbi:DNA-binding GntR family transcriptional regulator [Sphingobium fontiphilum]|uniref:DNA-binding GntR family transcriptional regulator n=1 Tax=Sphingobium fontiphilum TaxID=944425 RepID=A0A7W6DG82_9SPHN|nr:FCD domain-containing protein [Sphingobium fontiphilum]MBB3982014.1 DNA-binding GntR family transcriptional regulator [Sphingobium fontiphilum]
MTKKLSLTERAYRQLRDDLLTCRLVPGAKINIKDITATQGFSLGAVREALSRLTSEGFVTQDDARGFRVTPISISDLTDLVRVRSDIEGQCLRRAIERGGLDWEAAIVSAAHRLSKTPTRDPREAARLNEDYADAHAAFHQALVAACDSPWLLRMRDWLYAQSERYRYLTVPLAHGDRDLTDEHAQIVDAVLARDADRAVALLTDHLMATALLLIETRTELGGPYAELVILSDRAV